MRKLGVLGGTFDPVHEGHIALAKAALRFGDFDQVVLLPMARPAHREADASEADRLALCQLAVKDETNILVSQAGMASGVRYTQDTLNPLKKEFPHAQFTMIIGADKLPSLPYWFEADKLFSQCDFLCFPRSGVATEEAIERARAAGARVTLLPDFHTPYSASMIRTQTAQYQDAPGLKQSVLCYMAEHGLYQADFLPKLRGMMNPHRFQHTMGVRKEAIRLAAIHGLPIQRAALAGLLHDCAKGMSLKEMQKIAREQRLTESEDVLSSSALLHAPVGAYLAQKEFGSRDEDVLNAIRSHTVGRAGMSPLEMCIFVADATEEGREDYEGLSRLRQLSKVSLPAAVYCSLKLTQDYIIKTNRSFDSASLETMAWIKGVMNTQEKQLVGIE